MWVGYLHVSDVAGLEKVVVVVVGGWSDYGGMS